MKISGNKIINFMILKLIILTSLKLSILNYHHKRKSKQFPEMSCLYTLKIIIVDKKSTLSELKNNYNFVFRSLMFLI